MNVKDLVPKEGSYLKQKGIPLQLCEIVEAIAEVKYEVKTRENQVNHNVQGCV